jgi:hypothetical protein
VERLLLGDLTALLSTPNLEVSDRNTGVQQIRAGGFSSAENTTSDSDKYLGIMAAQSCNRLSLTCLSSCLLFCLLLLSFSVKALLLSLLWQHIWGL